MLLRTIVNPRFSLIVALSAIEIVQKLIAVNSSLFTAISLQTYFDRHCLYCNYFFLPLYSSETVNLARPFARRAANTRRPFFVAILSRKPCLFFLFLLEGWNVLFISIFLLYVIIPLQFRGAKIDIFFESTKQTDFFSSYFCLFCRFLVLLHPQNNAFCIRMSFFDIGQQGKHSNNNI